MLPHLLQGELESLSADMECVGASAGYSGISGANLAASLQRQVGRRGTLEVYASPGLSVTRVIGPVTDLDASWTRKSAASPATAAAGKSAWRGSNRRMAVQLSAVERGSAVAFHLDVVKLLQAPAYVQVWPCSSPCCGSLLQVKQKSLEEDITSRVAVCHTGCCL